MLLAKTQAQSVGYVKKCLNEQRWTHLKDVAGDRCSILRRLCRSVFFASPVEPQTLESVPIPDGFRSLSYNTLIDTCNLTRVAPTGMLNPAFRASSSDSGQPLSTFARQENLYESAEELWGDPLHHSSPIIAGHRLRDRHPDPRIQRRGDAFLPEDGTEMTYMTTTEPPYSSAVRETAI